MKSLTLFPVAGRELLAASRRPFTYYGRLLAAGVGGLFLCSFFWSASVIPRAQMSTIIFSMLSHLSLIYCLFLGARASADALSEEKREGTLGLLLLTDLRGHDVVFGKLAANTVNLFYGLLAVAPLMAIPLLLGGITGGQYARTVFVLLNALWLATSTGLWVSARSENEQRAFWTTVAILFAICVCPIIPSMFSTGGYVPGGLTSFGSPFAGIRLADAALYATRAGDFWICFGVGHVLGWLGLIHASRRILSYWRASADVAEKPGVLDWWERVSIGKQLLSPQWRTASLDANPIRWLVSRRRREKVWYFAIGLVWLICGIATFAIATWVFTATPPGPHSFFQVIEFIRSLLTMVLLITMATLASGFFAEARQHGALELILTTPVQPFVVITAQRQACYRRLLFSFLLIFPWAATSCVGYLAQNTTGTISFPGGGQMDFKAYFLIQSMTGLISSAVSLFALIWVGMWAGMLGKKPAQAATITFLLTVVGPWIIVMPFTWLLISKMGMIGQFIMTGLFMLLQLALALRVRRQLVGFFRQLASEDRGNFVRHLLGNVGAPRNRTRMLDLSRDCAS